MVDLFSCEGLGISDFPQLLLLSVRILKKYVLQLVCNPRPSSVHGSLHDR